MKKQHFCNFMLAGVSLTDFGLSIPSPYSSLEIANGEISSMTSWKLKCVVGGDDKKRSNIAAFEALLYSAAQSANHYTNSSGIPVSFIFGWLDGNGNADTYLSYQGYTLKFNVSTSGLYMIYEVEGYASMTLQANLPVLNIPAIRGIVQPSAIVEALAKATKATSYYELDIDHNDAPTLVNHEAFTSSFSGYVKGSYSSEDNYTEFPGLLKLAKSYNATRDAAGIKYGYKSLNQILKNASVTPIDSFLKKSLSDNTPQSTSFAYWVDEPTMTQPGVIHFKSTAGLSASHFSNTLEYGTANTNILSLNGSYNGVSYNISDMNFSQVGFALDGSGNTIVQDTRVVDSWSSSLADTFQTVNIINDLSAVATQFSGNFSVVLPGSLDKYEIAQPVSLLVMSGNTVSPISGVYNIMSVSHSVGETFTTTLTLQRLTTASANQVATSQGIYISGSSTRYKPGSYQTTKNIISPYKVDLGYMYPNFEHMSTM